MRIPTPAQGERLTDHNEPLVCRESFTCSTCGAFSEQKWFGNLLGREMPPYRANENGTANGGSFLLCGGNHLNVAPPIPTGLSRRKDISTPDIVEDGFSGVRFARCTACKKISV